MRTQLRGDIVDAESGGGGVADDTGDEGAQLTAVLIRGMRLLRGGGDERFLARPSPPARGVLGVDEDGGDAGWGDDSSGLLEHPERLRILGDGSQRKSYLYIQDCISAILHVMKSCTMREAKHQSSQVYNLGAPEYCRVTDSVDWICEFLRVRPEREFTGGDRGWIGDNPFIFLDTAKIQKTGWSAQLSIREGVIRTLEWLKKNQWVLERR